MDITQAINSLYNENSVLFLGAGFSLGSTNIKNEPLLTGTQLAKKLCNMINTEETEDLSKASEYYFYEKNSDDEIIKFLKETFTVKDIKNYHKIIANIPWKIVYTTNYDNTFEVAATSNGKLYNYVSLSDKILAQDAASKIMLHINGSIKKLNKLTLNTEFKLTNTRQCRQ